MRITFLLTGYPWKPAGGFRVVYEYANHLAAHGHEVTVVHPRRQPPGAIPGAERLSIRLRARADRLRNLFVRPAPAWQRVDPRVRMAFTRDLAPGSIPDGDVVFATWWSTVEIASSYPAEKGLLVQLVQHYETWGGPAEDVDASWRAPVPKVVVSRWLLDKGRELGVPERDMIHIPNAIDHDAFRIVRPIPSRAPVVSMLYAASEWKGGNDGIRALELARREHPGLRAILFGVDARPPRLPSWLEYVRNPSPERLVADVYNAASIYLGSSWFEGWYLPGAEAMACGCAVVSTDCLGIRDYGVPGETVLLSPPRAPAALAANLVRLLSDDDARIRLAVAGHERIRAFTWERSADAMEAWLERQLPRSTAASSV